MPSFAKLAIAAAAVVVVAVVGLNLIPGRSGLVGGPAVTPSPSPAPSPTGSPSPAPALNGSPYQSLQAGATYRQAEAAFTKVPFTFTVPDGWRREDGNFFTKGPHMDAFTGNGVGMAPWIVSHVYADACDWEGTLHATSTVAELTDALRTQKGVETTSPTVTTIGGRPANRLEISLAADADLSACDQGFMRLWPDAGPTGPDERYGWPIAAGQMLTVYVVDLDGAPQLIIASRKPDSSDTDVAELQQVIESIRFE